MPMAVAWKHFHSTPRLQIHVGTIEGMFVPDWIGRV
jgi:hypothetical protein